MKMRNLLALMIASALLVLSSTAMAQETTPQAPRNALRAGESALAFQVPSGGNPFVPGTLGYHYMLTDSIRGGLNLGLNLASTTVVPADPAADETSATQFGLNITPQLNYYTSTRGTVAPYFFGQLSLSTFSDGDDASSGDINEVRDNDDVTRFNANEQTTLGAALGYGVEWFPVTRFSISGQVGLNLNIIGRDQVDPGSGDVTEQGLGFNLFTSSLAANIYF
jgi:hypothetical protein